MRRRLERHRFVIYVTLSENVAAGSCLMQCTTNKDRVRDFVKR